MACGGACAHPIPHGLILKATELGHGSHTKLTSRVAGCHVYMHVHLCIVLVLPAERQIRARGELGLDTHTMHMHVAARHCPPQSHFSSSYLPLALGFGLVCDSGSDPGSGAVTGAPAPQ